MTRKLHISAELSLPLDFITSTEVVYGGKGMGKTNLGSVLVEECAAAGLRFSVVDPMGVWWGLRHSADGKGPGIEVLILGGIHGDIPIEPTGGAVVADLVVDEDANVIIDISRRPDGTMWSIADRVRFVRDYCKRLYQRQGEQRRPIKQLIDEAARFIPQVVRKDEGDVAACMGAIAVLVEEGRNVGVGVCLITQRSARLNKDVAELADCMIAFRTVGPNSRRAVLDWLGEHVEKDRLKDLDEKVRALPRGTALVVSPGWLEYEGIVPMRKRTTFDSSATPKAGEERRASGPGAKPDLAKYQRRMAATIEKAKAEDPRELRKRVVELERQLERRGPKTVEKIKTVVEKVEVPVLTEAQVRRLETAAQRLETAATGAVQAIRELKIQVAPKPGSFGTVRPEVVTEPRRTRTETEMARSAAPPRPVHASADSSAEIPKGERAVLRAVAHYPEGCSRKQLTTLTGYKRSSRDTYLQRLRERGLVELRGDRATAMPAGLALLGPDFEPLPIGAALLEHWRRRLPEGERRVLDVLVAAYPAAVERAAIDEATGYRRSSRDTYLQRLAARRLVEFVGRAVQASELLFDGATR